jgi:3-hydroxyacyl-CoA dehydrogenase
MATPLDVKKIAMIGCGSMGGGMAQLFAEHGMSVGLQDPSTDAMDTREYLCGAYLTDLSATKYLKA